MPSYPEPISQLIEALLILPGIGRKTAERFAFSLLQQGTDATRRLATALDTLHRQVVPCGQCGQFSIATLCDVCADTTRDRSLLCVVAESRDITSLEHTGRFRGYYFVLGGLLNPLEGISPERLRFAALEERLRAGAVREVILALDANVEGDATALYLTKLVKPHGVAVSRLARGLGAGARLEYVDEATLATALAARQEVT